MFIYRNSEGYSRARESISTMRWTNPSGRRHRHHETLQISFTWVAPSPLVRPPTTLGRITIDHLSRWHLALRCPCQSTRSDTQPPSIFIVHFSATRYPRACASTRVCMCVCTFTVDKKCYLFRSTNVTIIEDVPSEDLTRDDHAAARGELRPGDRNLDHQAWKDPEHRVLLRLSGDLLRFDEVFDGIYVSLLCTQGK